MAAKVDNQSDKHLIVNSIRVLQGIEGAGIEKIKSTVAALQNAQTTLASETQDYWSELADDGIITPAEKKILYKEWKIIQAEYTNLLQLASDAGVSEEFTAVVNYKAAYTALKTMLNVTLKLFDSMSTNTTLTSRETFIETYNTYYDAKEVLKTTIYGKTSTTTYVLDLTPEYQTFAVDGDGAYINPEQQLFIEVNLYSGVDGVDYAATRTATVGTETVGTWTGNVVYIPVTVFTEDTNYVTITVTDADGIIMSVKATISKLYAGNSIQGIIEWYASSTLPTEEPEEEDYSHTPPTLTADVPYLWNYEELEYTDGSTVCTEPVIIGKYGDTGNGIESVTEFYLASTEKTGITLTTEGWTESVQQISQDVRYLWNYEQINYTDGTHKLTEPAVIGTWGTSVTQYDMVLSSGAVKVDSKGEINPKVITVKKLEITADYTRETQTGTVTAQIDDGNTVEVDTYNKDETGVYNADASYAEKFTPIMIRLSGSTVLAIDEDTAAVAYRRT